MATAARRSERMTIEQFLEWDSADELRYELVDGVPVAMNPPMAPHARLVALLTGAIERRLRPPCGTYVGGGARRQDDDGNYRVPDLSISCSRSPGHWIEAPQVVVEILSPSTQKKDLVGQAGVLSLDAKCRGDPPCPYRPPPCRALAAGRRGLEGARSDRVGRDRPSASVRADPARRDLRPPGARRRARQLDLSAVTAQKPRACGRMTADQL